jgi:phenylacetate-coenzyme A ligase PaaK-like adenylate-forming protein
MHLFEDLVIVEAVDEHDRPVPRGVAGAKMLVTVLFSRTQPLIRYEMSDRIVLSEERCGCGLPFALLDGVEGRAEDVMQLPARSGGTVTIHPNVFHRVLERFPVREWQVVQEADGIRIVLGRPDRDADDGALVESLTRDLEAAGAATPNVRVERTDAVARTALGKAPLIKALRR